MENLKIKDVYNYDLTQVEGPFSMSDIIYFTTLLPAEDIPLNMLFEDDEVYNIPLLAKLLSHYKWKSILPQEFYCNYQLVQLEDDKPIIAEYVIKTQNYLRLSELYEVTIELIKC